MMEYVWSTIDFLVMYLFACLLYTSDAADEL